MLYQWQLRGGAEQWGLPGKLMGKAVKINLPCFFSGFDSEGQKTGHIHFCGGHINIVVSVGAKNIL